MSTPEGYILSPDTAARLQEFLRRYPSDSTPTPGKVRGNRVELLVLGAKGLNGYYRAYPLRYNGSTLDIMGTDYGWVYVVSANPQNFMLAIEGPTASDGRPIFLAVGNCCDGFSGAGVGGSGPTSTFIGCSLTGANFVMTRSTSYDMKWFLPTTPIDIINANGTPYDTNHFWNAANPTLVSIGTAGYYEFKVWGGLAYDVSGTSELFMEVFENNSGALIGFCNVKNVLNQGFDSILAAGTFYASANDQLLCRLYHSSASVQNMSSFCLNLSRIGG